MITYLHFLYKYIEMLDQMDEFFITLFTIQLYVNLEKNRDAIIFACHMIYYLGNAFFPDIILHKMNSKELWQNGIIYIPS